jgi:hypothetical protein
MPSTNQRPSTGDIPRTRSSPSLHHPIYRQSHPYMVALSGWPEPIYVPVYLSHSYPKSRPTTPSSSRRIAGGEDLEGGQFRDGVIFPLTKVKRASGSQDGLKIPPESLLSRSCAYSSNDECTLPGHPRHHNLGVISSASASSGTQGQAGMQLDKEDMDEYGDEDYGSGFPTSSARGTPHPTPPGSPKSRPNHGSMLPPPLPLKSPVTAITGTPATRQPPDPCSNPHQAILPTLTQTKSRAGVHRNRFLDPRLATNTSKGNIQDATWSSSSSTLTTHPSLSATSRRASDSASIILHRRHQERTGPTNRENRNPPEEGRAEMDESGNQS